MVQFGRRAEATAALGTSSVLPALGEGTGHPLKNYAAVMTERRRVYLARHGTPTWEDWWVKQNGYARSEVPDESQLMGFANYDLRYHNLPQLSRDSDGRIWVEVGRDVAPDVLDVMRRHGFEWARD